jgi:omega-hydroxy-beta-dihydromenaquinone-9 sulfotransferase
MLVILMTGMGQTVTPPPSFGLLFWRSFFPARDSAYRRFSWQRLGVMLLFWPLFMGLTLINRLCLSLDNLLFPGYQRIEIRQPVFVVGIPRSGTTFLHRLLAGDHDRFTTSALWELVFAPSILQRRIWLALATVDGWLGSPMATVIRRLERKLLGGLDGVHKTGLRDPEEDYLALAPWLGCFLLIVPFGDASLWQLAYLDRDAPDVQKKRLTGLYRAMIQRHLFVHGNERTFLSKNPSFTPWLQALATEFADARFIACLRDPHEAIPSQVNSILIGARLFSGRLDLNWWRDGLMNMMEHYYQVLEQAPYILPETRLQQVNMADLTASPMQQVQSLYQQFQWPLSSRYHHWLSDQNARSRSWRSGHHYHGDDLGLSRDLIEQRFGGVIRHFRLRPEVTDDNDRQSN